MSSLQEHIHVFLCVFGAHYLIICRREKYLEQNMKRKMKHILFQYTLPTSRRVFDTIKLIWSYEPIYESIYSTISLDYLSSSIICASRLSPFNIMDNSQYTATGAWRIYWKHLQKYLRNNSVRSAKSSIREFQPHPKPEWPSGWYCKFINSRLKFRNKFSSACHLLSRWYLSRFIRTWRWK
jgi:hypothetical protein